jgi:hypothetical protein
MLFAPQKCSYLLEKTSSCTDFEGYLTTMVDDFRLFFLAWRIACRSVLPAVEHFLP